MSKIGEMWRRLAILARPGKVERELSEEMRLHREMKAREIAAGGVADEEARYAANRAFGNATSLNERGREAWGWRWLEDFAQDLKFGARMLHKSPGFTLAAVLTLALGVGANTAIFSVVNSVLLRALPYRDPGRLVWASEYWPRVNDEVVPSPDYINWKLHSREFEDMAAFDNGSQTNLTGIAEAERIESAQVTANFLHLLGVATSLGRDFLPEEVQPGAKLVAILSDGLWRRKFGADPWIVGRGITLDGESYTIIGVTPAGFRFPDRRSNPDILLPFPLPTKVDWDARSVSLTRVIGRLKVDASTERARVDLVTLSKRTEADMPAPFVRVRAGIQVQTVALHQRLVGNIRPTLLILLSAVALVLLIACVNIANLQLARVAGRQKELAVRAAIGAARTRLQRQLLTESVVLAALGAMGGLCIAGVGVRLLSNYAPASFLQAGPIGLDARVLSFTFGLSCLTALLFGTAPAFRASNPDVVNDLKEGPRWRGYTHGKLRAALVVCELTLAVVLLAGSALLIRSFLLLSNVDPGFAPANLLTVSTALPESKYAQPAERAAFFDRVLRQVTGLPGVRSVALTTSLPLTDYTQSTSLSLEGRPDPPTGVRPLVPVEFVSLQYFNTLKMALRKGRLFEQVDFTSARDVVIVNRTFVQRYFPNEEPIGKRIGLGDHLGNRDSPWNTIVGVVGDVRHSGLTHEADAEMYLPYLGQATGATMTIRTDTDPRSLATAVRAVVTAMDAEQPVFAITTMSQRIADSQAGTRFNATLVGFFGFVALVLASVGVYGVLAYFVAQRTHEFGIRMALGASRRDVARMVMGQGMAMIVAGLAAGLVGATFATQFLSSLLYGIQPRDPATLGAAATVLAVVALAACYAPARTATKAEPMVALRHE